MPKINVYLPDDLATAVREARIPVSPVCQKALAKAVRTVGSARKAIEAIRDPSFDPGRSPQISVRVGDRMTLRLREAMRRALRARGPDDRVGTRHLLIGMLDERHNLGVRLLEAFDVDPDELRSVAAQAGDEEPASDVTAGAAAEPSPATPDAPLTLAMMTVPARGAIASALEASIDLGHNYLGCEHLLLGLLAEDDGAASRILRDFGVDAADARRAVTTAAVGAAHVKESPPPAQAPMIEEVLRRLEAVERRLGEMRP